jgi:hypothetical protein
MAEDGVELRLTLLHDIMIALAIQKLVWRRRFHSAARFYDMRRRHATTALQKKIEASTADHVLLPADASGEKVLLVCLVPSNPLTRDRVWTCAVTIECTAVKDRWSTAPLLNVDLYHPCADEGETRPFVPFEKIQVPILRGGGALASGPSMLPLLQSRLTVQ